MKQIQLTRTGGRESCKRLAERLKESSRNSAEIEVYEICDDGGDEVRLEAIMVPNSDRYSSFIEYLFDNNADEVEYNLNDLELKAQIGLSLMTVAMSMGARNCLFVDKQGKINFAMIAKPTYENFMKSL